MFRDVQRRDFLKRFVSLRKHRHIEPRIQWPLGHPITCFNSISNLRKRGKHIQVGLLLAEQSTPAIPMSKVIAHELEILGSHGMQAHRYDVLFAMIESGKLSPEKLIGRTITLEQSIDALVKMDKFEGAGVTVVTAF